MENEGSVQTEKNQSVPEAPSKKTHRAKRAVALSVLIIIVLGAATLGGFIGARYFGQSSETVKNIKNVEVQETSAIIDVVNKVTPSVVSITSVQSSYDFFGRQIQGTASGTGFIVKENGLVMTNKHVVSDPSAKYSVFTSDGKEYSATLKATDPVYDLAFLKIEAKGLKPAEFSDSDQIRVGQKVIAIGNALGQFQNTVTSGIVSAVGRALEAGDSSGNSESLENMIQIDAAINSGNSGGPLLNILGQVIGINTAVAESAEGIGFALPINLAKYAMASVETRGKIIRPMIGVRYINITKDIAARNKLPVDHGALIYSSGSDLAILPGSPAAKAGLKEGDIITKIGNEEIGQGKSLVGLITKYNVGDKVKITYVRDDKTQIVEIVLTETK